MTSPISAGAEFVPLEVGPRPQREPDEHVETYGERLSDQVVELVNRLRAAVDPDPA